MRDLKKLAIALALLAGCGDDTPGQNGNPGPPPPPPAPPAAKLAQMVHIEDLVTDHEKGSIRHQFKERDFAVDQNRDPFQSFIIAPQQIGPEQKKTDPGPKLCKDDKVLAQSYSVTELGLVGIVAQGIAHKALLMGGNVGYIVKTGDCVGREKAVVREINDDFMTLVGQPDPNDPNKPQDKFEKTLHPKRLAMGAPEIGFDPTVPRITHPVIAPPTQPVPPPLQPKTTTTTTIVPFQQQKMIPAPPLNPAPSTITP